MKIILGLVFIVVVGIIYALWNPTAKRIRKIQVLINKDRTVCDFINSLDGWSIGNIGTSGLRIMVDPVIIPMYALYITYKEEKPSNNEIKELYYALTNIKSDVHKAHQMNIPYEDYLIQKRK